MNVRSKSTVAIVLAVVAACTVKVRTLQVVPIEVSDRPPVTVTTPVKAHLNNGDTVIFDDGVVIADGRLSGVGHGYDLFLNGPTEVTSVPLPDVAAMESYQTPVNTPASTALTVGATAGGLVGGALLYKAIFGSCPTIYTADEGGEYLEAESFSYSIAPVFETRDVDRLGGRPQAGWFDLQVRNEALETHYINQIELLEVVHSVDESAFPDPEGGIVVVGPETLPFHGRDRDGRDIGALIAKVDGLVWHSDPEGLADARAGRFEDHIELEFPSADAATEVALTLRLRNTLLSTVLLYDVILGSQGVGALDWLGRDVNQFIHALDLGYWYQSRMGMRISLWDGERFRQVEQIPDQGPIAWKEIAVTVPVSRLPVTRLRLSFVVDNWTIDRIELRPRFRRATAIHHAPSSVLAADGAPLPSGVEYLASADETYLTTRPADSFGLRFDVDPANQGSRTWMVAAQGYYIEWLRGEWLRQPNPRPYVPGDDALLAALDLWAERRDRFRAEFESTRIPVR